MAAKNVLTPIILTGLDASLIIVPTYTVINFGGFPAPLSLLRIINASNTNVLISFDGQFDHDFIIAGQTLEIYAQALRQPSSEVSKLRANTEVYVRGAAGIGHIYVAGYYLPE